VNESSKKLSLKGCLPVEGLRIGLVDPVARAHGFYKHLRVLRHTMGGEQPQRRTFVALREGVEGNIIYIRTIQTCRIDVYNRFVVYIYTSIYIRLTGSN
jgi:hypothetical protein